MAAQDDEMEALKGAVLQTLETKGTLRTIRAQLRASVFEAVKEGAGVESAPLPEPAGGSSEQASLLRDLMHEYMAFYGLEYSRDVFSCEAGCARAQVPGRSQLRAAVGLAPRSDAPTPLLAELLHRFLVSSRGAAAVGGSSSDQDSSLLGELPGLPGRGVPVRMQASVTCCLLSAAPSPG